MKETVGDRHPNYIVARHQLAELLIVRGDYDQAEPIVKEAVAIQESVFGSNHPKLIPLLKTYAELLRKTERESEAKAVDKKIETM